MKNELDKRIKEALENLETPYRADHWSMLEGRLDHPTSPPDPADAFDAVVASRLEGLEVPLSAGTWNQFEEKMEQAEAAEIDQAAYEKLQPLEAPYNATHWLLMKERLDDAFSWRRKLVRYKVAEVVLMLLLLFTVIQQLPLHKKKAPARPPADTTTAYQQTASAGLPSSDRAPGASSSASVHNGEEAEADLPLAQNSGPDLGPGSQAVASSSIDLRPPAQTGAEQAVSSLLPSLGMRSLAGSQLTFQPPLAFDSPAATGANEAITPPIAMMAFDRIDSHFPGSLRSLSENGTAFLLSSPTFRNKKSLRVGMFASLDYNYIQTPFDEVFDIGPYAVDSTSFSGGITLAYRFGRWEIETGGIYSNKSYRPLVPVQQFGTFDYLVIQSFEGIHLDVLQIPLMLRRNFLSRQPKWDLYLSGGISANLILKPIYEIRQTEVVAAASVKPPPPEELVEEVNQKSKLNRKDFPAGIFHGGSFIDNSYFTASLGLGVERMINYRWSLFLEPNFQYQFPVHGFGPNDDRFHSLSFRLGTRVIVW